MSAGISAQSKDQTQLPETGEGHNQIVDMASKDVLLSMLPLSWITGYAYIANSA